MHLSKGKFEKWQEFQEVDKQSLKSKDYKKKAGVVRFVFDKTLPGLKSYPTED